MIPFARRRMTTLLLGMLSIGTTACSQAPAARTSVVPPGTVAALPSNPPADPADMTDSWVRLAPSDSATNCFALTIDPRLSGVIYAGCRPQGFLVSRDLGRSWVSKSGGMPGLDATSWQEMVRRKTGTSFNAKGITIDPLNPRVIYGALEWNGVFKSTDGGETWQQRADGLEPGYGHNAIHVSVDPFNTEVLYLGTDGGVYKSVNGAASWRRIKTGLPVLGGKGGTSPLAFAIDPTRPSIVYTAFQTGGESDPSGVYKSVDAGETWKPMNAGFPVGRRPPPMQGLEYRATFNIIMDPVAPATLYAVSAYRGVYKTVDGAAHWSLLPATDSIGMGYSLLIDPRDRRTLYLGVHYPRPGRRTGVYMSTDAGTSWRWIGLRGRGLIGDLGIDVRGDGALYAAASSGIYKLPDPRRQAQRGAGTALGESGPELSPDPK